MTTTPLERKTKLEQYVKLSIPLYFKREDLHPLRSHKGRSIPLMIKKYFNDGITNFVISSSGNAALAAALFVKQFNLDNENKINLTIFVGEKINPEKLSALNEILDEHIKLQQVENPKQVAFQMDINKETKNLRQSTDNTALIGYEELAKEIAGDVPDIAAIFIPSSSGTCAEGLHLGFKKLGLNPEIHIVQTDTCHPLVNEFKKDNIPNNEGVSFAQAIVDQVGHRKITIAEAVAESHGNAWIANNEEIMEAMNLVKEYGNLEVSPNSALSIVGLLQAIKNNWTFSGPVVCLITGK